MRAYRSRRRRGLGGRLGGILDGVLASYTYTVSHGLAFTDTLRQFFREGFRRVFADAERGIYRVEEALGGAFRLDRIRLCGAHKDGNDIL
jgi:hypothetical protein